MNPIIKQEIKRLQGEIERLLNSEQSEKGKQVIPFLKLHKAHLHFNSWYGAVSIKFDDDSHMDQFIKLIQSDDDGDMYHFSCYIDDQLEVGYDDGVVSLRIKNMPVTREEFISVFKKFGLKVDFSEEIEALQEQVRTSQSNLQNVISLDEEINGQKND